MIHHPDFYKPDDDRPQFACLPEVEQAAIIFEFFRKHPRIYKKYYREALTQLPDGNTQQDRREYVARCIVHNHGEQEDWTL